MAAVRYLQISNDLPELQTVPMPKLSLVERGIHRARLEEPSHRPAFQSRLQSCASYGRCDCRKLWTKMLFDVGWLLLYCSFFSGWGRSLSSLWPVVVG